MNTRYLTLMTTVGLLAAGLLVCGQLYAEAASPLSSTDQQDTGQESGLWGAVSISKETILLLLAAGIAGVMGISRKKKKAASREPRSKFNQP